MAPLELPYPISVGRLEAGDWFAQVPDWLRFEGRLGVKIGEQLDRAREAFDDCVKAALDDPGAVEINWSGAEFAPGETSESEPLIGLVLAAAAKELGRVPRLGGGPHGADMRLYCERGIPCVMYGTNGLELAHAPDERVATSELATLSRTLARVAFGFAQMDSSGHAAGDDGAAVAA
jgi:acetylornithine deacetylase